MLLSSKKSDKVSVQQRLAMSKLEQGLKGAFSTVREEMAEHLRSINENTAEMQQNAEYLAELEGRIDKMEGRIDEVHMMFRQILDSTKVAIDLSVDEQKVFLILYTQDSFLSAEQIAERFAMPVDIVLDCLLSMSDKGIPTEREILDGRVYYKLDSEFKSLQAKEQIVKIDSAIKQQFQNKLLKKFFSV